MLIIGTSNNHRFKSLKDLIAKIDDTVDCIQKSIEVEESGNNSLDNARIKASTYAKVFLGENVLCVDDEMNVNNLKYSPGEKINRDTKGRQLSQQDVLEHWRGILKGRVFEGHINKAFVFINSNGQEYTELQRMNIKLIGNGKQNLDIATNPLNHFIVPEGFNKAITEFSLEELSAFRMPQLRILERLLVNYIN